MRRWTHAIVLMGAVAMTCPSASSRAWCQATQTQIQNQTKPASPEDRRKRIEEDAAKLLVLANELKALVDKTTKDQMSLEVIRKSEQVEKAARELKQRMREAS